MKNIEIIESEMTRTKKLLNTPSDAFNYIMYAHLRELAKLKSFYTKNFKDIDKDTVKANFEVIQDDIIDVISGIKFKDKRDDAAQRWANLHSIDLTTCPDILVEIEKGETRRVQKAARWELPSSTFCLKYIDKLVTKRTIWLNETRDVEYSDKTMTTLPCTFGTASHIVAPVYPKERYFTTAVKGEKIIELGYLNRDDAIAEVSKLNDNLGGRRSTALKKKSKFKTPFKYVSFHYAFGGAEQSPTDSKAFALRGGISKTKMHAGIKFKDFEYSEIGMIHARFYVDQQIRSLGLDLPLVFSQADYDFIHNFGPRMYIEFTGWSSSFEYNKYKMEIIHRYYDVSEKYKVVESYSKRLIKDTKPEIKAGQLSAAEVANLSKF